MRFRGRWWSKRSAPTGNRNEPMYPSFENVEIPGHPKIEITETANNTKGNATARVLRAASVKELLGKNHGLPIRSEILLDPRPMARRPDWAISLMP